MTLDEIFDVHLARITTDLERWLALFAPDTLVEYPYAASLGYPARIEGRDALRAHFQDVIAKVSFGKFTFSNVRRYPGADPDVGWFEVHGVARNERGEVYEQDYVMHLRARDGLLVHYAEYWNPVPMQALLARAKA